MTQTCKVWWGVYFPQGQGRSCGILQIQFPIIWYNLLLYTFTETSVIKWTFKSKYFLR